MGFGEMLGIKDIKIETKTPMNLEELFEKIKDVDYGEAGVPTYVKHGFTYVIAFPKIDNENQVWVIGDKGKFHVQRSASLAGVGESIKGQIKADVMNNLTGGISGIKSTFGAPKKTCMAHCDIVAEKIKALGL